MLPLDSAARLSSSNPLAIGRPLRRYGLLMAVSVFTLLTIACEPGADATPDPGTGNTESADPIAQIRADYARIMQTSANETQFSCPTDPFAGRFASRTSGDLSWLNYTGGHEHGVLELEALLRAGEIVFVMQAEASWAFDPDPPADFNPQIDEEPTIDTEIQERYYFDNGQPLKALYKKAQARSSKDEAIETVLAQTNNVAHPRPKYSAALSQAKAMIAAQQAGEITETWCGPE